MLINCSLFSSTWNSQQNEINLVSILPYKMLIIFIVPRPIIKPVYRIQCNSSSLTGLPVGYVVLTGLPIGYSVIVALTGSPIAYDSNRPYGTVIYCL